MVYGNNPGPAPTHGQLLKNLSYLYFSNSNWSTYLLVYQRAGLIPHTVEIKLQDLLLYRENKFNELR